MATFYVLPPRHCLDQVFSEVLSRLLPGLAVPADGWDLMLLHLAARSCWTKDLYLIPRDDLPVGEPLAEALRVHFGAESGDRVVEVPMPRSHWAEAPALREWTLEPVAVSGPPSRSYNHTMPDHLSPPVKGLI